MGYFANDHVRRRYEKSYCRQCVHEFECPVMAAQSYGNRLQYKYPELKKVLDMFIPEMVSGRQRKCKMFAAKAAACDCQAEMFE